MDDRYVVLSGCSGGGKSTLLADLRRRGYSVVDEPGRRVVREVLEAGGDALPWLDIAAFARRAIAVSLADRLSASILPGLVFFDRGLIDAACALQHATGIPAIEKFGRTHRYHRTVFLTPPWPEIYLADAERRHGFADAVAEYESLKGVYPKLGYSIVELPKICVSARADLVVASLEKTSGRRGRAAP